MTIRTQQRFETYIDQVMHAGKKVGEHVVYFHPLLHPGLDVPELRMRTKPEVDLQHIGSQLSVLCLAELDGWSAGACLHGRSLISPARSLHATLFCGSKLAVREPCHTLCNQVWLECTSSVNFQSVRSLGAVPEIAEFVIVWFSMGRVMPLRFFVALPNPCTPYTLIPPCASRTLVQ